MNLWKAKVIQQKRREKYFLQKRLHFLLRLFSEKDRSFLISGIYFSAQILQLFSPLFLGGMLLILNFLKFPMIFLILGSAFVFSWNNHQLISEQIHLQEIDFLFGNFFPRQRKRDRLTKLILPFLLQTTLFNRSVFLGCWLFIGIQMRQWFLPVLIFFVCLIEFFLELLFWTKQNVYIKAICFNQFKFLKKRGISYSDTPSFSLIVRGLIRSLQLFDRFIFRLILILFLVFVVFFSFFKQEMTSHAAIFLFYYCSFLPTILMVLIKKMNDSTLFFDSSEITNYYYMKRFQKRNYLIDHFTLALFRRMFSIVILLLLPIYFFQSFFVAVGNSFLCLVGFFFLLRLNFIQKTATVNQSIEDFQQDSYQFLSAMLEDFFIIGSETWLCSLILLYSIKYHLSWILSFFPVIYFIFIIFYVLVRGWVICASNSADN
ncbi:MAG: hypothetical protein LBT69_04800 [Lactobacillales bacterium]|jgi:hypothetical protein|nr:hypothetical protein [Lactobacillales bacterium]